MANRVEIQVKEIVEETIEKLGYTLFEVAYDKKKNQVSELVIYIDHEAGITLEDCETVSVAIDPLIEAADPIEESYVMCVSSPEIDRPLKTTEDFTLQLGAKIEIKLYQKVNGKKEFVGVLKEVTEEEITLEVPSLGEVTWARKKIALARPYIEV